MPSSYAATPPFARGKTFYNGQTPDTSNYGGTNLEGAIYTFRDIDPANPEVERSGKRVTCQVVRNTAAAALLPKRLVVYAAGLDNKRVDGYTSVTAEYAAGVVDEFLPAAGVPVGDLFYIVIDGPTLVKTFLDAGAATNVISAHTAVMAITAATSGATTAGRITQVNNTTVSHALGRVGRAISATSSGGTDRDLLIDVKTI